MVRVIFTLTLLVCFYTMAFAAVPPIINYQGKLVGADNKPVADGSYKLTFFIYDAPTGGTMKWTMPDVNVYVKGGVYSVLLGGNGYDFPTDLFDSPDRFFAVKVGNGAELTPRQQIASVPFAMMAGNGVPAGNVSMFAGAAAPPGYLLCTGQAVSRVDYGALFAAIGTTYGAGDGTTTFNLPNMQGRVGVGLSAEPEFNLLGKTGGEKTHTLTIAEMPSHAHFGDNSADCGAARPPRASLQSLLNGAQTGWADDGVGNTLFPSVGGSQPHNNLQPYLVMNYIIKY